MDERIHKLPQWAQKEFLSLARRIADLELDVARLRNENPKSRISYNNYPGVTPIYIDELHPVQFEFDGHRSQISVSLRDAKVERDGIYINGTDALRIIPQASNACVIQLERRF